MAERVAVIVNPAAGGGRGRKARSEVERGLEGVELPFTLHETRAPGDAIELARNAAEAGAERVVAVGGDGTIHEVANGLLGFARARSAPSPVLGIVPVGTGNDFAKLLEGTRDRERVYRILAGDVVRRFDVGRVSWNGGEEYFINGMGTGIDVEVVRQIARLPHMPGAVGYLLGLLRALVRFDPIPLRLRVDGKAFERTVMIVAIGNGPCLGGGFFLCPDAKPDDGRFDICIVNRLGLRRIAATIPRVLRGTHVGRPGVEMLSARTIELEPAGTGSVYFHLDGELREPVSARRLSIELQAARLPVLAPNGAGSAGR